MGWGFGGRGGEGAARQQQNKAQQLCTELLL